MGNDASDCASGESVATMRSRLHARAAVLMLECVLGAVVGFWRKPNSVAQRLH